MDEEAFSELAQEVDGIGEAKAADLYDVFSEAGAFDTDAAEGADVETARDILADDRRAKVQRIQMALSVLGGGD